MKILDSLWGGTVTHIDFDVVTQTLELGIRVLDGGAIVNHTIECRQINDLHFFNQIPEPWSYAEVTEVAAAYDQVHLTWKIELMLWSEGAGMAVIARKIQVDSVPLKPGME